ncbi:MAG: hypothetical protein IT261_01385 [Saprospiraceae bacterium]|nr:hypothetical protein [Saprospiraceae bacterium]
MQIDIPAHIEKLLYLHDSLVIPGFGGFTATRTPATTDYVGGTVNPPSKTLVFSENLVIDDGLLTADIADAHGISTEDAGRAVEEFVERMRALLDQREIVTLPGVGRLYKNYVQKIQFLPDATNFNSAAYGLPPLQFSPIARSREISGNSPTPETQTIPPTPPAPPMPEPTYAPERTGGSSGWGTAIGIILLLAALAAGIWYWKFRDKPETPASSVKPETEIVEKETPPVAKPSKPEPEQEEPPTATNKEDSEKQAQESLKAKEEAAREKVNVAKNGRECILIIASLSDKTNADKLRRLLQEEGYGEYYQFNGKAHVVGIRFQYLKASEIEEKKKALMALTGVSYIAVKKK